MNATDLTAESVREKKIVIFDIRLEDQRIDVSLTISLLQKDPNALLIAPTEFVIGHHH
jgi:hypothetical protein